MIDWFAGVLKVLMFEDKLLRLLLHELDEALPIVSRCQSRYARGITPMCQGLKLVLQEFFRRVLLQNVNDTCSSGPHETPKVTLGLLTFGCVCAR